MFKLNPKKYFDLISKYPILSNLLELRNGFLREEKEDKRDYIFGASDCPKTILQIDGQWKDYLPAGEKQSGDGTETFSCVSQSLLNCVEILIKKKYTEDKDYSDRFLAKMSGTSRGGNAMSKVIETLRKKGTVREDAWADIYTSWDKYYEPIPRTIQEKALLWTKEYEVQYERVLDNKELLMEALKYSPLWTSGYAWAKRGNLYVTGGQTNHAFTLVGYVKGSHWIAFDSYDPFIKHLAWDFNLENSKVILINKKSLSYNTEKLDQLRAKGFEFVLRAENNGEVYKIDNGKLIKVEPAELMKNGVKTLSEYKKLIGITEEYYNSLLK
jgi:hypothetical protein